MACEGHVLFDPQHVNAREGRHAMRMSLLCSVDVWLQPHTYVGGGHVGCGCEGLGFAGGIDEGQRGLLGGVSEEVADSLLNTSVVAVRKHHCCLLAALLDAGGVVKGGGFHGAAERVFCGGIGMSGEHDGARGLVEDTRPRFRDVDQRLGRPRKRLPVLVATHRRHTVRVHHLELWIQNNERRDALDFEEIVQCFPALRIVVRDRQPRHFLVVLVEAVAVVVGGGEDDLKGLPSCLQLVVRRG
mmetsp:Transcript_23267/g.40040  ORF Transcript_23267/g.40040 Transcript_23267/m.40040 type:complete len:243 (+) Transcript_23267:360-1088(+)